MTNKWFNDDGSEKRPSEFYKKEMERLERNQKDLHDQYNQENKEFNVHEYVTQLRAGSSLKYAWPEGESLNQYIIRLQIHVDIAAEKNIRTHVMNNGRGCWFTHTDKFGVGCFMDEDMNLIYYLTQLILYFSRKYPSDKHSL